jgi:hypothetical protein
VLPLSPEFDKLAEGKSGIESSPHVTEGLLIPGTHVGVDTKDALSLTATSDVALADGAGDSPHGEITIKSEEALEIHVKIFADGLRVRVPASNPVDQFKRNRVNRSGRSDGRAAVEAGETCSAPEDIGDADDGRYIVGIAVEDDRSRVQSGVGSLGMSHVHRTDEREVVGRQMTVSCGKGKRDWR